MRTFMASALLLICGAGATCADEPFNTRDLLVALSPSEAQAAPGIPAGKACTTLIPGDARCPSTATEDDFNRTYDE